MVKTDVVFETDEDLQSFLMAGLHLPTLRIWCKISEAEYNDYCDVALGDDTKLMSEQFYALTYESDVYVVVGRSDVVDGVPTGNFKELTKDELYAWVNKYGALNMHLFPPEVVTELA